MSDPTQKASSSPFSGEDDAYTIDLSESLNSWSRRGECNQFFLSDPDFFFSTATEMIAKTICNTTCTVRTQCRDYALSRGIPYGVWGGLTEKERQATKTINLAA